MLKIGSYFIHRYESKSGETQKMAGCLSCLEDSPPMMPCPFPARSQLEVFQSVSSVVFPFFVHPRKLTRNLPFQGSIFRFHVSFRGSNQYFVYLFVEFQELLDSSYVQQFSMFQVDKDNVTMNVDGFQAFKQLAADIQYQY